MTRPRAADDFATIRARMEELRRERAQAPDDEPHHSGRSPAPLWMASAAVGSAGDMALVCQGKTACKAGHDALSVADSGKHACLVEA